MNPGIIASLMAALIRLIPAEGVKIALDALLDKIEDYVKKTPNKWDDNALRLCAVIRAQLNIPDNDAPATTVTTTTTVTPPTP